MKIVIDDMYKVFKWKFSFDGQEDCFNEEFTGKFWNGSQYYGFGEVLANLMWVKSAMSHEESAIESIDLSSLKNFIGYDCEYGRMPYHTIFYTALAELAYVIYNQTAYCIQCIRDNKHRDSKKFKELYSLICKRIGQAEDDINEHAPNRCMEYMFSKLDKLNDLMNYSFQSRENQYEIIHSLVEMIDECFDDDSKTAELLSCYQFESGKNRCVAAYIFKEQQKCHDCILKGYIAFSGYIDCEDKSLLKKIKASSKKYTFPTKFILKLHKIADQLQLKLITTNESICICEENSLNQIQIHTTLGQELNAGKRASNFGKSFACSERKIFTEFYANDTTPPAPKFGYYKGTLHVKFQPCNLCDLSIQYEQKQSHRFDIIYYMQK